MALRRKAPRGHDLFPGFTDVVELGGGSLATVFRAREVGTQRLVALKLLNVRDAAPRAVESFERESFALGALGAHPNIVTLYRNFWTPDDRPVLVLELCAGSVANRLSRDGGLPVADCVAIGIKIAGALETAHRGGILHRDVKPQNILVTEFGEPALADFGVAMLQSSTQTTAGLFDFTTLHAAPELLEGGGTSAATDVYELASSLYQLITGRSAFRAYEGESPASVILRILRDPVRPLSGVDVPARLSDQLVRAMSKDQGARPPTAAEFAAGLAQVEIEQGWPRTQFLIRDAPSGINRFPAVSRMPDVAASGRQAAIPVTRHPQPPLAPDRVPATPVADVGEADVGETNRSEPIAKSPWIPPTLSPQPEPAQVAERIPVPLPEPVLEPALVLEPEPEPEQEPEIVPDPEPVPAPRSEREGGAVGTGTSSGMSPSWWAPVGEGGILREPFVARASSEHLDRQPAFPAPPLARAVPEQPTLPRGGAVPVWTARTFPVQPDALTEPAVDPSTLRPRLTVRSGTYRLTVDEDRLTMRRTLRTEYLAWTQISGFQQHFPSGDNSPQSHGVLVALTPTGAIELRATKRSGDELRRLHALLEAYRLRSAAR